MTEEKKGRKMFVAGDPASWGLPVKKKDDEQRCGNCRWWAAGKCVQFSVAKDASNTEDTECWRPEVDEDADDCIDCERPLIIGEDVFCKRCLTAQKNNKKLQKLLKDSKPLR